MYTKYYTPTLEEFHIGFEYEFLEWNHTIWTNEIFKQDSHIAIYDDGEYSCDLESYLKANRIRVKYLDKEDIESLGFKNIGDKLLEGVLDHYIWYNNHYWVYLDYTRLSDHCVIKIEVSVSRDSIKTLVVHSIGIKNKSELKILFNQLNIYK
jgi:hypothetical protein